MEICHGATCLLLKKKTHPELSDLPTRLQRHSFFPPNLPPLLFLFLLFLLATFALVQAGPLPLETAYMQVYNYIYIHGMCEWHVCNCRCAWYVCNCRWGWHVRNCKCAYAHKCRCGWHVCNCRHAQQTTLMLGPSTEISHQNPPKFPKFSAGALSMRCTDSHHDTPCLFMQLLPSNFSRACQQRNIC